MKKEDFEKWYRENLDIMVQMGVFHPDSPFGKTVHLAVASVQPQLDLINARLMNLERELNTSVNLDQIQSTKIEKPKPKTVTLKKEVSKPKSTTDKKPAKKKQPVVSEWQIAKK